jgi:hypothetical protein
MSAAAVGYRAEGRGYRVASLGAEPLPIVESRDDDI